MTKKEQPWRQYAKPGEGVHFPYGVPSHAEQVQINMLVDMNDRRDRYIAGRNPRLMMALSKEYESRGMPSMAREVRADALKLSRRKRKNAQQRVSKGAGGGNISIGLRDGVGDVIRV